MSPEFIEAVEHVIARIPEGRICTYGEIARQAGYPGYARHVGHLLANLPDSSSLPWFRVLNASRTISRRDAASEARQRCLLLAEGVPFRGQRVPEGYLWP